MRTLVILLSVQLFFIFETTKAAKIVCYHTDWSGGLPHGAAVRPEDLNASLCTHINFAFVNVKEDGSLTPRNENAEIKLGGYLKVTSLKTKNKSLKVLLSIGGGDVPRQLFARIAADPLKRSTMVQSARKYMETYKFDGIDLDWEVPLVKDKDNFIALLQDFRKDFDRNGWELSAAVNTIEMEGYDIPKMSRILNHINLMTYDMYGPWSNFTGQNSPLYASSVESAWQKSNLNLDAAVSNWIKAGASLGKLVAGLAFYGRTFTLKNPSKHGLHAPITGPGKPGPITGSAGSYTYLEFCKTKSSWNCVWDEEQRNPYCTKGDQWLGIDNQRSIREKVSYIKSKGIEGAMIWNMDFDDVHGLCGESWPLLKIVHNGLHNKT